MPIYIWERGSNEKKSGKYSCITPQYLPGKSSANIDNWAFCPASDSSKDWIVLFAPDDSNSEYDLLVYEVRLLKEESLAAILSKNWSPSEPNPSHPPIPKEG